MDAADRLKLMSPTGKSGTLEFRRAKNKEHYWVFKARNGETIGSCLPETYKNKGDCLTNCYTVLICGWNIVEEN